LVHACRLYLFEADSGTATGTWKLEQRAQLDCSGIFDMRWAPHTRAATLALALADGSVLLVRPCEAQDGWQETARADVDAGMVLTLDWARHAAHAGRAVVSTSTGQLAVLQVMRHIFCVVSHRCPS